MKTNQNIKAIVLGLIVAVGISYASAWTGPSLPPTYGNVPAPINVGGRDGTDETKWYTQTKTGILNLAHLITSDLTVTTGTPVAGQVLMASSSAGDVKWGNAAEGNLAHGIANTYSLVYATTSTPTASTWTDTGLAITVTPTSATSKFMINANIVANNGDSGGDCAVGLFKNSTSLVSPFSQSDESNWNSSPKGVSYIDNAQDTNSRTYMVKTKNNCYLNRDQGNTYHSSSTMTILEIN